MALFSQLRKLVGFALVMLIVTTSIQPVQAHLSYSEGRGSWLLSAPSTSSLHGLLESALYISEENEEQTGRKGPSQRLGTGDPFVLIAEIASATLIPIIRHDPPFRAPPPESGISLTPLKTGPPSV